MNKEKYNDPTAEIAIAHVMMEQKRLKLNEYKCSNESGLQGSGQKPKALHSDERIGWKWKEC